MEKIRKGLITFGKLGKGEYPYFVDFDGWNEGSASPIKTNEEMDEEVAKLIKKHSDTYKLTIKRKDHIL